MQDKRFRAFYGVIAATILIFVLLWQVMIGLGPFVVRYQEPVPVYRLNPSNFTYSYPIQELLPGDYNRLINLENFYFQVMDNVCNDSNPLLLILIHSAPGNFGKRQVIRDTWGQPREGIKIIFLLALTDADDVAEQLQRENEIHRDFAQGNFMDTYRNMTYKHVMVLKYVIYHCPQAKYILKTDDDILVNIETMLNFLKEDLSPNGVSELLLCKVQRNAEVYRSYRSKWRVSVKEFPNRTYPNYCPGFAILYSQDVVFNLYKEAQRSDYFWIDDVHITGILAKKVNITHTDATQFILSLPNLNYILDGNEYNGQYLYGPVNLPSSKIRDLWYASQGRANKKIKYYIQ